MLSATVAFFKFFQDDPIGLLLYFEFVVLFSPNTLLSCLCDNIVCSFPSIILRKRGVKKDIPYSLNDVDFSCFHSTNRKSILKKAKGTMHITFYSMLSMLSLNQSKQLYVTYLMAFM